MIKVTQKDALKSKTLPPGWQICEVTNHYVKPAKETGVPVHYYEIEVYEGQYKGVPLSDFTVSQNAIGFGKEFYGACGMDPKLWEAAEKGEEFEFDEKKPVGQIIRVHVKPEPFGGRTLNKANGFMAMEGNYVKT